jgi:hypothetical protein
MHTLANRGLLVSILLLLLVMLTSCSSNTSLVGKTFMSQDGLEALVFIDHDTLVYLWPCTPDDYLPCAGGNHSMPVIYWIDDAGIGYVLTSTQAGHFPYEIPIIISPDGRELRAMTTGWNHEGKPRTPTSVAFTLAK